LSLLPATRAETVKGIAFLSFLLYAANNY